MKAILHIPHSSACIPSYDGYIIDKIDLGKEIQLLTDWFTDDLFYSANDIIIKANFSRVFCDVERFENDDAEIMAQMGMGVLYTHSDAGKEIRAITSEQRKRILSEFYIPHHKLFNRAVKNQLEQYGKSLIIDCHSFPDSPFRRDLKQQIPRPDFNIGFDTFHTPQKLIDISSSFFETKNFSLGINFPYAGSIVPAEFYEKNENVITIMLEVNKKLYLKNNSTDKSDNYFKIKEVVKEFIEAIKNTFKDYS